jgi:tetratricopeptide (TPR) repeat protein
LEQFELDLALKFINGALDKDSENCSALETKALILLEMDQPDEARELLLKATELDPDDGPSKFMYLGQLSAGEEAVAFYEKGVEIMKINLGEVGSFIPV